MYSKIRRRSFLTRLGAVTTVGALATVTGGCDQMGLSGAEEEAGEAKEPPPTAHFQPDTGATDTDAGINADPVGQGRSEANEE